MSQCKISGYRVFLKRKLRIISAASWLIFDIQSSEWDSSSLGYLIYAIHVICNGSMPNVALFFFTSFMGSRRNTKIHRKWKFLQYTDYSTRCCNFTLILVSRHWKSSPVFDMWPFDAYIVHKKHCFWTVFGDFYLSIKTNQGIVLEGYSNYNC